MDNKILIIEVKKDQGEFYKEILARQGLKILGPVSTDKAALELYKNVKFDLILMDILLPDDLDEIKINIKQNIPIIYITGNDNINIFNRAVKTNPYGYLVKPFPSSILIATVLVALNKQRVEKILKRKEKKYRLFLKGINNSIVCLKILFNNEKIIDFKIIEINNTFSKFTKIAAEHLINKSVFSLFPEIKKLYPEWLNRITSVINKKSNFKKLIFLKIKNLWLNINIIYLDPLHIIVMIDDITENILNKLKISEDAKKYKTIFETSSDAVMILKNQRFIDCNQATLDLFGFKDKNELLTLNLLDISPPFQEKGRSSAEEGNKRMLEVLKSGKSHFEWIHHKKDGADIFCDVMLTRFKFSQEECFQATVRNIDKRKNFEEKIRQNEKYLGFTLSSIKSILIVISSKDIVTHWNSRAEDILNLKKDDVIGKHLGKINLKWEWDKIYEGIANAAISKKLVMLEDISYRSVKENNIILGLSINPILDNNKKIIGFLLYGNDITQKRENETLQLHNQKLVSIGELAAGIAHEINTPSQYINDNLIFLKKSFYFLKGLYKKYNEIIPSQKIDIDQGDLDFYLKEIPIAVEQSLEGITNISKIVSSMKTFSHPGTEEKSIVDINKSLSATIIISKNEWKYAAELETFFDSANPEVEGFPAELNQVFLNIIVNAAHAIEDAIKQKLIKTGKINITTVKQENTVEINISDNGAGISDYIKERIFDPFFTTKEIGKGSGQGLAISHQIITKRHNGKIFCKTKEKKGTVFYIILPLCK